MAQFDEWSFWRAALAGGGAESTPGTPHAGYFLYERNVSLPHNMPIRKGAQPHRPRLQFPCAIWFDSGQWNSLIVGLMKNISFSGLEKTDDLFSSVCGAPISYGRFLEMQATIQNWRDSQ